MNNKTLIFGGIALVVLCCIASCAAFFFFVFYYANAPIKVEDDNLKFDIFDDVEKLGKYEIVGEPFADEEGTFVSFSEDAENEDSEMVLIILGKSEEFISDEEEMKEDCDIEREGNLNGKFYYLGTCTGEDFNLEEDEELQMYFYGDEEGNYIGFLTNGSRNDLEDIVAEFNKL